MKRTTDSPAWRHIHMLASLTSPDGNTPLIAGFNDGREQPTAEEMDALKNRAEKTDLVKMAKGQGVARYMSDDPVEVLKDGRFGVSFNLDGIWGGNMYAGGAGAILPNKITSKHNFRYVPKMNGMELVKKLRAQLDKNGYKDVEIKLIGDVPWSRGSSQKTDISVAHKKAGEMLGMGGDDNGMMMATNYELNGVLKPLGVPEGEPTGGYWPSYLFLRRRGRREGRQRLDSHGHGRARRQGRPRPRRQRVLRHRRREVERGPRRRGEDRRRRHLGVLPNHHNAAKAQDASEVKSTVSTHDTFLVRYNALVFRAK